MMWLSVYFMEKDQKYEIRKHKKTILDQGKG